MPKKWGANTPDWQPNLMGAFQVDQEKTAFIKVHYIYESTADLFMCPSFFHRFLFRLLICLHSFLILITFIFIYCLQLFLVLRVANFDTTVAICQQWANRD